MGRPRLVPTLAFITTLASPSAILAEPSTAPIRLRPFVADSTHLGFQALHVDLEQIAQAVNVGAGMVAEQFPLPDGQFVDLELRRFAVTGPDTQFVLGQPGAPDTAIDFDVSRVVLLRGAVAGQPGSDVFLALGEPMSRGHIHTADGRPLYRVASVAPNGALLPPGRLAVFEKGMAPSLRPEVPLCGLEAADEPEAGTAIEGPRGDFVLGTKKIEIAIETDYELFALLGDTDSTLTYLTELFAAVSHIYERDVSAYYQVTFIRLWTTPDDLFNEPNPASDFANYWNVNMSHVQRDVAQFVSGRRDFPYGGVALGIGSLCGGSAYSVVGYLAGQLPDNAAAAMTGSYDIGVVAHELGHNCGSIHTHDYFPPIDDCFPPPSTYTRGEIMSYCSQQVSGGDYVEDLRFTTRVQAVMRNHFASVACLDDDCNRNGIADSTDISAGTSADANFNGRPDECEDCNANGILDPADITGGTSADVGGGGVPDECEPDCNGNNRPDRIDIAAGTSLDLYWNGVPDECDPDCDADGTADYNELQANMPLDVNRNQVLDSCEDCDGDGTLDAVELAGAHSCWVASQTLDVVGEYHSITGVLVKNSAPAINDIAADALVLPDGRVLVSTLYNNIIAAFDPMTGASLGVFNQFAGAGVLQYPAGMALGPNGNLFVCSFGNDRVLEYHGGTGAFIRVFVSFAPDPFSLTFGPNDTLFVGCGDNQVREYHGSTGALLRIFVKSSDNGGLSWVRGMTFKADGNLLVAGYGSNAVLEYDGETGAFLRRFDSGTNLYGPWGLRVGPNGNVYVTRDWIGRNHTTTTRIYELNGHTGTLIRSYLLGDDTGLFSPSGIAFAPGWDRDCNLNAIPDNCDVAGGASQDANGDGIPDECELDCNTNGVFDRLDLIPFGGSYDCNGNGRPDECDLADGLGSDCDGNGRLDDCDLDCNGNDIPDPCDIAAGTSQDCLPDGIPDECQPDCNGNGFADSCDLAFETSGDCNQNSIPDECEMPGDCNTNGIQDICDVTVGLSLDCNNNDRPDECELLPGLRTEVHLIPESELHNVPLSCGGGSFYNCGSSAQQGFDWTDVSGADVLSVRVEFNIGLNCHPSGVVFTPTLNGSAGPVFATGAQSCACSSLSGPVIAVEFTSDAYNPRGVNMFRLANTSSCFGFAPRREWTGACARVIVRRVGDCNVNGRPDDCDLAFGSPDTNDNGVLDECEDCNQNGVIDEYDIAASTSRDCNLNGAPDECELDGDCNQNGTLDVCDLRTEASNDCNGNGVPDECDIASGASDDANGNGIADECDTPVCYAVWSGFEPAPPFTLGTTLNGLDTDGDGRAWQNPALTWTVSNLGCPSATGKAIKGISQTPPTNDFLLSEWFHPVNGALDCGAAIWTLTFDARSEAQLNPRIDWQMSIRDASNDKAVMILHWASTQSNYPGVTTAQGGSGRGRLLVRNPAGTSAFINSGFALPANTCYQVRIEQDHLAGQVKLYVDDVLRVTTTRLEFGAARMDYFRLQQLANGQAAGGTNRLALDNLQLCQTGATLGWPDCNANCQSDLAEIASGRALDCNGNSLPDECELAAGTLTDDTANGIADGCVMSAVSRKAHSSAGVKDLPIAIAGRVQDGNVSTEPRDGGLTELRLRFDAPPGAPGPAPVEVSAQSCSSCPCGPGTQGAYVPVGGVASSATAIGRNLTVSFSPGLSGPATYRVEIDPAISGFSGGSVEVRALRGDADGNGRVNAVDRSLVVGVWTGSGFSVRTDFNLDGAVNSVDRAIVVGQWTSPTSCAP